MSIPKYSEVETVQRYEAIETKYAHAITTALKNGQTFFNAKTHVGIGIGEAMQLVGFHADQADPIHRGIVSGFFGHESRDPNAEFVVGRKMGARLRKLVPVT